ncbi:hypothetical protein [Pseudoxanthomonas dokdonensis]|uniref:Uncharacterized protein n=1 Tax=Pseudoxanthomonas dokdonensis TaxID=344882 RepID=A0A0R0CH90_9GAMM|nr:hypothetical protein [Pseudoxanthomonas dokdonensis]KRG68800.1 hypothetical protein ABB29_09920 [Pseudoxanthomonas dokdonensis]
MSNSLRLLETLGQNPTLSALSAADLETLMADMALEDQQRDALRAGDSARLSHLLGGRMMMMPMLREPGESEERSPADAPQRDDDSQDEPQED